MFDLKKECYLVCEPSLLKYFWCLCMSRWFLDIKLLTSIESQKLRLIPILFIKWRNVCKHPNYCKRLGPGFNYVKRSGTSTKKHIVLVLFYVFYLFIMFSLAAWEKKFYLIVKRKCVFYFIRENIFLFLIWKDKVLYLRTREESKPLVQE